MLLPIDTAPPLLEGLTPSDGFGAVSITGNFVFGFSEAIQRGTGSITIRESSGPIFALIPVSSTSLVTLSGKTVTISLGAPLAYATSYFVDIPAGAFTDLSGNPFAGLSTYDFTTAPPPDTTAPTIALQSSKSVLKAGDAALITFTLNEPSANFIEQDVTVSGGTLSNFSGSGVTYTATFTAAASGATAGGISVANGKFSDAAGNVNVDGADADNAVSIAIDTTLPTIALSSNKAALKAGELATITFTLSEPSTNFTGSDVSVTGGTLTDFSGSGNAYTATLSLTTIGMVAGVVKVPNGVFTDIAGNANADGADDNNTLTITAANSAPTGALTVSGTAEQGQTLTVSHTLIDADGLGSLAYQWTAEGQPIAGATGPSLVLAQAQVGKVISVRASYTDQRGNAEQVVSTATGAVLNVNDVPVANAQSLSINEDTSLAGTLTATDIDSSQLTYAKASDPTNGTVTVNPNGTFTYAPTLNFHGTDSFTFTARDGLLDSAAATVTVNVIPVNDSPSGASKTVTTSEDIPRSFSAADFGFADPDAGDAFGAVRLDTLPAPTAGLLKLGDLAVTAGQVVPASELTQLRFVPAANVNGAIAAATAFDIGFERKSPTTGTLKISLASGQAVDISLQAYLTFTGASPVGVGRDADSNDGWMIDLRSTNQVAGGYRLAAFSLDISPKPLVGVALLDISFPAEARSITVSAFEIYAPLPLDEQHMLPSSQNSISLDGTTVAGHTASFTFSVRDAELFANQPSRLSIDVLAVNDAPVANAFSLSTNEDTLQTGTLTASDIDSTQLTYAKASDPTSGAVTVNPDGTFTYTPALDFNGTDTFTFKANDGSLDSAAATVTIKVSAINDAPVANALSLSTNEDTAHTGTLTASDIDSPQLTYTKASNPTNGTVTVNPNGTFTYTPALNFHGTDSFTFKANDGSLDSAVATVTITVNAVNDAAIGSLLITGTPGQGLTLQASLASFSDPDSPPPPNQSIRYEWRADNTVIANVTGPDLFLTSAITGKSITVRAHFKDGLGTDESITSSPTGPVIPASIAGEVRYWHDSKPVAAAEIRVVQLNSNDILGATIAQANANAEGRWSIPQLDFNTYALKASRTHATTDHSSVTAADVLSALKLSAGRNPNADPDGPGNLIAPAISPYQVLASEVTGDGVVRSDDALRIMRAALKPEASAISHWAFIAEGQNLSGVSRHAASVDPAPTVSVVNSTTSNWIGILLGDVDGSWNPGGAA